MVDSSRGVGYDEAPEIDRGDNIWTDKLESYFIYLMVDEIMKGTMQATTFANAAWKSIAEALRKRTGKEYTYNQLKNKYHNLRARWSDFSSLLREKDLHYNSLTGEVKATEDVWRRLYLRYRRAKSFRKKGMKDYDKLCVIFAHPGVQSTDEVETKVEKLSDNCSGDEETSRSKRSEKFYMLEPPGNPIMGEKTCKKQKLEKKMACSASLDSVADHGDVWGSQSTQVQDVVRCMVALNALEGIDGASYVKATRYIHDDPLWRKMFLCMPDERKKDWVLNI